MVLLLDLTILPWLFFLPGIMMFFTSLSIFMFPFVSYTSDKTLVKDAYAGWRPSGAFGFKFQLNQEVAKVKYPMFYKTLGKLLS